MRPTTGWTTVAGVALPGVALAVIGLYHPAQLTPETAARWWQLHVLLLPVFPLLGAALWVLLHGENGVLAWIARVAAYMFAMFYTGLDALAGIGAGIAVEAQPGGSPTAVRLLALGNELAEVGVYAFLVATVLTSVVLVRREGVRAAAAALVLVAASIPFLHSHIYWPVGGLTMLALALGCALLAATRRPA